MGETISTIAYSPQVFGALVKVYAPIIGKALVSAASAAANAVVVTASAAGKVVAAAAIANPVTATLIVGGIVATVIVISVYSRDVNRETQ